jgi:hypothetical protein
MAMHWTLGDDAPPAAIGFLRVPEPKTAKNRLHIGPEGNEFCVA